MNISLQYNFEINFSEPIINHTFSLRVTPRETAYYDIIKFTTNDHLKHTKDGFGNTISFGRIKPEHNIFDINAYAKIRFYANYHEKNIGVAPELFLFDLRLTDSDTKLLDELYTPNNCSISATAMADEIKSIIYNTFEYKQGITTSNCTINKLLEVRAGVCQDFAHLMIAILRRNKIPARYVNGFVVGEGESHAWVEYFDGKYWLGADPTHNILITDEPYIKLAHGRDASDVTINKGLFYGKTVQSMKISAIIKAEQ
jgi:transglutaminase-like putative cysteine protease